MIDGGNSGPEAGGGTELERFCAGARVAVLLPLPLAGAYDYLVPEGLSVAAGTFVEVPLGGRRLAGVVWGGGAEAVDTAKLKPLARTLPAPKLPEVSRRFVEWVAAYTVQPPGAVLRMVMSVPEALAAETPGRGVRLAASSASGASVSRAGAGARRRRRRTGALHRRSRPARRLRRGGGARARHRGSAGAGRGDGVAATAPRLAAAGRALSPAQAAAADTLRAHIDAGFAVDLLDGVPGAGKTEVYFEAVAAALARGRQVLVLLPEIALGTQWRARFADRFGAPPTEWHSDLSRGERRRTWRAVAEGRAQVIVGARSALFLPIRSWG